MFFSLLELLDNKRAQLEIVRTEADSKRKAGLSSSTKAFQEKPMKRNSTIPIRRGKSRMTSSTRMWQELIAQKVLTRNSEAPATGH